MNYIDLLTQEEKTALCKELFKRNEQEFSKIRKGFRAKSLNENTALSIAIANVDKPFITAWINLRIDFWIKEIQDNIERLKAEGSTADIAMAMTMIDSVFANNVDLYLKLLGEATDEGSRSKLRDNIEFIKAERAINAEVANRTRAIEEENQRLLDQINDVQKRFDDMQVEMKILIILHSLMIRTCQPCPMSAMKMLFLYAALPRIIMGKNGSFVTLI